MADPTNHYEKVADLVVERHRHELNEISQKIWKTPEVAFEEHFAHDLLTGFLEEHGFSVIRHWKKIRTAFWAEFHSKNYQPDLHPTVALLCEYDALPELGHACGHNLIAETAVAAALILQAVLGGIGNDCFIQGRVIVLGTPAEEDGGGKVLLIREGAFTDIDFAMMVHPWGLNDLEPVVLGMTDCKVDFYGKAAHAACGPWEGLNAMDAAVSSYEMVARFRQQMQHDWRLSCIFWNSGTRSTSIPDWTTCRYDVRALTLSDLNYLKGKLVEFCNAAAKATGCTVKFEWAEAPYSGMMHSSVMSQLYRKIAAAKGVVYPNNVPAFNGSTDMGDVSLVVPSIHPGFYIGQPLLIHTADFRRQAGSMEAQEPTLTAAKTLALTAVELFLSDELRKRAKEEFMTRRKQFVG
ncbi:Peptidase M20 domain-containing protein 2 [Hypsibius exemplaris]|uniref:Peptidase M20 domain-containing protein 2 n=1 Tax=Hypsibius exemplaris TaxID=2072580 RepID=A0A1W0X2F6_HYPEX|nr:Peptidase M20 domain-containing protein 2 [Hypsibius exemplaris]